MKQKHKLGFMELDLQASESWWHITKCTVSAQS